MAILQSAYMYVTHLCKKRLISPLKFSASLLIQKPHTSVIPLQLVCW